MSLHIEPQAEDFYQIQGNVSPIVKQEYRGIFQLYSLGDESCYAYAIGDRIVTSRIDVYEREGSGGLYARSIAHLLVEKDMVDVNGYLHLGCISYLLDICTASVNVLGGLYVRHRDNDDTLLNRCLQSVSQTLSIQYIKPAKLGTRIKIVCSISAQTLNSNSLSCEIRDYASNALVATGAQVLMPATKL